MALSTITNPNNLELFARLLTVDAIDCSNFNVASLNIDSLNLKNANRDNKLSVQSFDNDYILNVNTNTKQVYIKNLQADNIDIGSYTPDKLNLSGNNHDDKLTVQNEDGDMLLKVSSDSDTTYIGGEGVQITSDGKPLIVSNIAQNHVLSFDSEANKLLLEYSNPITTQKFELCVDDLGTHIFNKTLGELGDSSQIDIENDSGYKRVNISSDNFSVQTQGGGSGEMIMTGQKFLLTTTDFSTITAPTLTVDSSIKTDFTGPQLNLNNTRTVIDGDSVEIRNDMFNIFNTTMYIKNDETVFTSQDTQNTLFRVDGLNKKVFIPDLVRESATSFKPYCIYNPVDGSLSYRNRFFSNFYIDTVQTSTAVVAGQFTAINSSLLKVGFVNGFEISGTSGVVKFTGDDDTLFDVEWSISYNSSQTAPYIFTMLTDESGLTPNTEIKSLTFTHYSSSTSHNFNMSGRSIIQMKNNQTFVIGGKGSGNITLAYYSLIMKEV